MADHVVDFINTDQSCSELEHVITQGDDNELCILCPFLDIGSDDRDLSPVLIYFCYKGRWDAVRDIHF